MKANVVPLNVVQLKSVCSGCSLRELCLPMGLSAEDVARLDQLVYARRKVKRGEGLYRAGDLFRNTLERDPPDEAEIGRLELGYKAVDERLQLTAPDQTQWIHPESRRRGAQALSTHG